MTTDHDLRALFAEQPFCRWWGLQIVDLGDGSATVRLPIRPELLRPGGILHGSGYEVVADTAMWLAIMTRVGIEPMAVTIEMKTSFLGGATTDVTATARVLRVGRRAAFGVAEIADADGTLVAHSTLTYLRPSR
jgi:uncharacterized protein (TIGR00369 family)